MSLDVVVYDAVVLTVDERNRIYENGTVLVDDGDIVEVRTAERGDADIEATHVIDGEGTLVMPGLVNAHTHLESTPLVGAFSDLDLRELMTHMSTLIQRFESADFEYLTDAGYELAALNFLRGGVTTVNSMDVWPAAGAETFGEAGLRGFFGPMITDLFWDVPVDEQFERAREFIETYHDTHGGRIRASICPHDDWSCSRSLWERTADLAAEYPDVLVHTHLLELEASNVMGRANGSADSLSLLEDVGLLDDRLLAAHFRVADETDVRRTAEAGASVAHCPSVFCYWNPDSEMQWTPVPELREAGVDVGLGIDDHYWHDSYSMFEEARQARMAANLKRTAGQYSSMELVRMLTIDGAGALGIDDEIGSIEPGKRADLLILDVSTPKFTPLTNAAAHVVNNATPADVETVLVDGEVVLSDGTAVRMDAEAIQQRVEEALDRFTEETGWNLHLGGADPPGAVETVQALPKRSLSRLLARLAVQSARDRIPL